MSLTFIQQNKSTSKTKPTIIPPCDVCADARKKELQVRTTPLSVTLAGTGLSTARSHGNVEAASAWGQLLVPFRAHRGDKGGFAGTASWPPTPGPGSSSSCKPETVSNQGCLSPHLRTLSETKLECKHFPVTRRWQSWHKAMAEDPAQFPSPTGFQLRVVCSPSREAASGTVWRETGAVVSEWMPLAFGDRGQRCSSAPGRTQESTPEQGIIQPKCQRCRSWGNPWAPRRRAVWGWRPVLLLNLQPAFLVYFSACLFYSYFCLYFTPALAL